MLFYFLFLRYHTVLLIVPVLISIFSLLHTLFEVTNNEKNTKVVAIVLPMIRKKDTSTTKEILVLVNIYQSLSIMIEYSTYLLPPTSSLLFCAKCICVCRSINRPPPHSTHTVPLKIICPWNSDVLHAEIEYQNIAVPGHFSGVPSADTVSGFKYGDTGSRFGEEVRISGAGHAVSKGDH